MLRTGIQADPDERFQVMLNANAIRAIDGMAAISGRQELALLIT